MKLYAHFHLSGLCLELREVEDWVNLDAPFVQQTDDVYAAWKAKQGVPPPAPEPTNDVPQSVSPWQMRRALNQLGLRAAVEAAVVGADQDTKDGWEYASEIRRDNPLIIGMAAALGLGDAELDHLFLTAASFQ